MRISVCALLVTSVLAVANARGQDVAPAAGHYTLTAVQATQLKAAPVVYETVHTTPENRGEEVRAAIMEVMTKLAAAKGSPTGGPICVFTSGHGGNGPLDIDVCVPVKEGTATPEGLQSKVLESVSSVTGIYQGPMKSIGRGYADFFRQLQMTGKIPTGEIRQRSLFYEDDSSPNNIVLIEAVVATEP